MFRFKIVILNIGVFVALIVSWTVVQANYSSQNPYDQLEGYELLIKAKPSGNCLDESTVSDIEGGNVHQWDCHGGNNQIWRFEYVKTRYNQRYYQLKAKHSNQCLDVEWGHEHDGANIRQWSCNQTDAQLWTPE